MSVRPAGWLTVAFALAAGCGQDAPVDGGLVSDAMVRDVSLDEFVDSRGGGSNDDLLCQATCVRQERAQCPGFRVDVCPTDCVTAANEAATRCRREVDGVLRCSASFAEFTCDLRGLPTTMDCAAEEIELRRCLTIPSIDAGPMDAVPTEDIRPDARPDALPDAPAGDDAGLNDADSALDASIADGSTPEESALDGSALDGSAPEDSAPEDSAPDGGALDGGGTEGDVRSPLDRPPTDARPTLLCPTATAALALPGVEFTREETTVGANNIPSTRCQLESDGPEHAYDLTVTARTGIVVDTQGLSTSFDTVLSIRRSCNDPLSELACDDDTGRDRTSSIRALLDPGRYSILVDGYGGMMGRYALRVSSFTPAANAVCTGAVALAHGTSLRGQNADLGGLRSANCRAAQGGPLFYAVSVPALSRVTVRATPTGAAPWTPLLGVMDTCAATTCSGASVGESPGGLSSVLLVNSTSTPRTFFVALAAASSAGTFDLAATAAVAVPRGATCETAVALTAGTPLVGQDASSGFLSGEGRCASSATGAQRFFTLRIPGRQRATLRAMPTGAPVWAATIRLLRFCGSASCAASSTGTLGAESTALFDNEDAFPLDLVITVSGASPTASGTFDLVATLAAIPSGGICDAAPALTPGTPTRANSLTGLRSGAALCAPSSLGGQLFYALRIPAAQRATVRVTPMGSLWRPTLRVLSSCMSTSCLQQATADGVGAPATLAMDNVTTAPRDLIITVAGASIPPGGAFELTASLSPITPSPYVLTTIPVSCDALDPASSVTPAEGWDDDTATDALPLPFSLRFFGATMRYYAVSSNGFAQLFPDLGGEADVRSVNSGVPNAAPPNGYIAPFWDDLTTLDAVSTDVRAEALGVAPGRRFVIQWGSWQILGDAATRLTFQAKVFESNGAIELHYCAMTPPRASVFGSGATLGVENPMGVEGVEVGFNRSGAIDPMNAFRLSPR